MSMSVCGSVCPRGYLRNHTRDLYQFLCMLPVFVVRSSSYMFTIGRIAYCREGVFFPIDNAYISGTTRAIFTKFFVHVACVCGSIFLRQVYDRPHRLSPGRGFLPQLKMHYRPGNGGWECIARAKYAIYDCLVHFCSYSRLDRIP